MHYQFAGWHWPLFIVGVLALLALDLRVFHRTARVETFRGALGWTVLWFSLAILFAAGLWWRAGIEPTLQFATGYLIELSLSMDNVFVMALIFSYFGVPGESQHRVLFLGILGALLLRGLMIWLGVELVQRIQWMLEVFGAFLLVSGLRMLWPNHQEVHPERNPVMKLAWKLLPLSPAYDGQKFIVSSNGARLFTPLALVLIAVETTDLLFALDSIPAIFGITQEPFLVFSSNVFAILGLRSLYFVLAGVLGFFRYLKLGLALVLVVIGVKMLVAQWLVVPTSVSLAVVAGIFALAIAASVAASGCDRRAKKTGCTAKPSSVQELR